MTEIENFLQGTIGFAALALQHVRSIEIAGLALPFAIAAFAPRVPLRSYLPLLLLPAMPMGYVLLGTAFFSTKPHETAFWLAWPIEYSYEIFLALTLVLVWRLPELRLVTVALAAVLQTFLTRTAFTAGMAVSGSWL